MSESTMYGAVTESIVNTVLLSSERFIVGLYEGLGTGMALFASALVFGWLIWNLTRAFLLHQQGILEVMLKMVPIMVFYSIAVNPQIYLNDFYKPLMHLFTHLPGDLLKMVGTGSAGVHSPASLFMSIDYNVTMIVDIVDSITQQASYFSSEKYTTFAYSFAIQSLFISLQISFLVIFALSILSTNLIFGLLPIGVALATFPSLRFVLISMVKGLFTFGLMASIASVIMAMVMSMISIAVLNAESQFLTGNTGEIPYTFFVSSIVVGGVGLVLILMTGTFTSMITSGHIMDGFGQQAKKLSAASMGAAGAGARMGVSAGVKLGKKVMGRLPFSGS